MMNRIVPALLLAGSALAIAGERPHLAEFTLPSKVRVRIVEANFSARNFEVTGCGENSATCFIDSRIPFGVVDRLPRRFIEKLEVSYEGRTYALDASDMYDAWGDRKPSVNGVRYFGGACADADNCEFRGVFSDGAASFAAEWRVVGGRASRTVLTDSGDVVDLFLRNIDPPTFE
jgi:hypothetical protein